MGLLGKLAKTVIDVATLPVDVAHDAVTLGGTMSGGECKIAKKVKKICRRAKKVYDSLDTED